VSFGLPEQDFMPRDIEESIIPFADSLLEFDRPTTVEKRYASLRQRYKDNTFFFSRLGRAEEAARSLLGRFKSELSISFEDVARDVFQQ
jgi:hypothetical protein